MSHRLQVLIPEELNARLRKAAVRNRMSTGAWVRRAVEESLRDSTGQNQPSADPLARLGSLDAPTAEIGQMIAEIESGRS